MKQKSLNDERSGFASRRANELKRLINEGAIEFDQTIVGLKWLIEGKRVVLAEDVKEQPEPVIATSFKLSPIQWVGEVEVNYGVRPSFEELNGSWFNRADTGFLRSHFVLRPERADAPTTGIKRVRCGYFYYMGSNFTNKQGLKACQERGVKPMTDLEVIYSGKKFPEVLKGRPGVGLGSYTHLDYLSQSALLDGLGGSNCSLHLTWNQGSVARPYGDNCCLLVCE